MYLPNNEVLVVIGALLVAAFFIKATQPDLQRLPGPFMGRRSKYYRVWLLCGGKGPLRYWRLHQKYGPVVRTGPNHVSISDPDMIPAIYDLKGRFFKV